MVIESISVKEISLRLDKGRSLLSAGTPDVALLVVLSALEAAMRLTVGIHSQEAAHLSPAILSSFLFSHNLLSRDDYEFILTCSHQRNAVVHGFRQLVSEADVDRLQSLVNRVIDNKNRILPHIQDQTVVELIGDEPYEYTPLGEYIVKALGICSGRPTFKYTRIEVMGVLARLTYGETFSEVIADYEGRVSRDALQEAIEVSVAKGILDDLNRINELVEAA